jgi:peptidoglycan hydrolase-like protein with peptidoglycan-binding domain
MVSIAPKSYTARGTVKEGMTMTMQTGSTGPEVRTWQTFLLGEGLYHGEVTGVFDAETRQATVDFQRYAGLGADGIAGPKTIAEAVSRGMAIPGPPADDHPGPLSAADRAQLFGTFAYRPSPTATVTEAITITDGWPSQNIVTVDLPQLAGVLGAPGSHKVPFHRKAAPQLQALWAAWEEAGLLPLVLSWAGSWAPRFVRGSRTNLSNHAWGTAFDINAGWNGLGKIPAASGAKGSCRDLVPLAHEHGFFWGGNFPGRPDGMHFEVRELL